MKTIMLVCGCTTLYFIALAMILTWFWAAAELSKIDISNIPDHDAGDMQETEQ